MIPPCFLQPGEILIAPIITQVTPHAAQQPIAFTRYGFPLDAAYAVTDYYVQVRTLPPFTIATQITSVVSSYMTCRVQHCVISGSHTLPSHPPAAITVPPCTFSPHAFDLWLIFICSRHCGRLRTKSALSRLRSKSLLAEMLILQPSGSASPCSRTAQRNNTTHC